MINPFESATVDKMTAIKETFPVMPQKKNLKISIGQSAGFVVIEFSLPTTKITITKKEARELIRRISSEVMG